MTGFIDPLEMASVDSEAEVAPDAATSPPDTLEQVRNLVLLAHPEVVPELVHGASLTELLASVEPAHRAYAELVARLHVDAPSPAAQAQPTHQVPAGGAVPAPLDLERMPTAEKLRRGIRDRISPSLR